MSQYMFFGGAKHDGMCFKQLIQHKNGQHARWMPILLEIYHLSERIIYYNINVQFIAYDSSWLNLSF